MPSFPTLFKHCACSCSSDGGSDLLSPQKALEQSSDDGSSDTDGELSGLNYDSSLHNAKLEFRKTPALCERTSLIVFHHIM